MGNVPVSKLNEEDNQQRRKINMFDGFCGNMTTKDIVKHIEVNEIILSKTYSYPKGTYNSESIKLFNQREKQLFYFSAKENVAAVRYLTINGVNINILDEDRTSPLHISCRSGSLQMVEELINQGSMINLPDLVGWTPLHIACFQARPDIVLLLLKNGANYKFKNRDKLTPFELCPNNKECLEIYNNFTIHERIELMRIIQLQKMKLEYIENYIKNWDIKAKEEYICSISNMRSDCNDLAEPINTEIIDNEQEMEILRNQINRTSNGQINDPDDDDEDVDIKKAESNKERNEEDEDNDIDEVPNEFVNYNDEENKKKNKDNLDITQKYLAKYKYIPKKHKFYLQYQMCNGKILQRSMTNSTEFNSSKEAFSNPLLVRLPNQFPVMTSIQQLNKEYHHHQSNEVLYTQTDLLLTEEHEKYKAYDNASDCEETNVQFNHSLIVENKGEIYSNNNNSNSLNNNRMSSNEENIHDESTIIEDIIGLPQQISNVPNKHNDSEKIVINDHIKQSFMQDNYKLITDLFFHHLNISKESIEDLFIDLFHFDYKFSLLLVLTINKHDNTYGALVHILNKSITSKQLKSTILIGFDHHSPLMDVFLSSCNTSKLKIKDILHKIMNSIINLKDIFCIDRISKSFAKTYYPLIQNTDENKIIKSQNALYFLIFSLLITEMSINSPSSLEQKEKYIYDLMIILKDMNEGECFNQDYLNSLIKYIKVTGFFSKEPYKTIDTENIFSLGIKLNNGLYKSYYAYYYGKGFFILFLNKKALEINRIICLNVAFLNIQANGNMIVVADRYEGKKGRNVFILHNKKKFIKIKQYEHIKLFLDDKGKLNDIMQGQ